jgi:hypothetical protein
VSAPRLRTDFWVAALRRRAEAEGAYVSIARKGAEEAGVVFVMIDCRDGRFELYGPAPQSVFDESGPADRRFSLLAEATAEFEIGRRMEQELRFDPDLWLIDIAHRNGSAFLDVVADAG